MKKVLSAICAISVLALGLTEIAFTFTGFVFPRPLTYVLMALCVINASLFAAFTKEEA